MKNAKVYLVGSGLGDVELITLKSYRLIAMADVVLYEHLIPSELLLLARPDAQVTSGRRGEELEACVEARIDFEVVPGITSAFAAPIYAA